MANIHVIIGEDDFLVSETAKKTVGDAVGLEVIDSANAMNADLQLADLREADASFSTPPFLDPRKVTWWKNVGFLPQGGKGGPSEDVKAALEKFARKLASAMLPDNQHFIVSGPRLLMASFFAKALKPVAEIIVFEAGKPWEQAKQAVGRAIDFAQEAGFSFAPNAADAFVARVGCDTRSLLSEVGKLRDYLGGERKVATVEDVAEITSTGVGVETAIWSITDALGARNVSDVVAATRRFERESGFAVIVTNLVEKFFRQLAELKDAQARGFMEEAGKGMAPFALRKNQGFLRNWSLGELRMARYRFQRLRERAVSSSGSADVLVLTELVRCCCGNSHSQHRRVQN